jgi:hypothetical protein
MIAIAYLLKFIRALGSKTVADLNAEMAPN